VTFYYHAKKEYAVAAEEVAPPSWWELLKKYGPWIIAGGAVVGAVYVATRKS
jgi:hypothetical protein